MKARQILKQRTKVEQVLIQRMKVEKGLIQLLKPTLTDTTNENCSSIDMINVIGANYLDKYWSSASMDIINESCSRTQCKKWKYSKYRNNKLNGRSIDTINELKSINDIKNVSGWIIYTKNEIVQALVPQKKVYQFSIQ